MTTPTALSDVGRYELLSLLGEGGFSTVYEARDRGSGARVALKQLARAGPNALARFKQEFRALQGVHHPNLVELHQLFEQDGAWFIAMDLIEGVDLIQHLRRGRSRAFDVAELQRVFAQLVEGLMALHAHGVVHRDLKPRNVLVTPQGRAVLLDFGLIEVLSAIGSTGQAGVGSADYMAPEQVVGGAIGPSADFYSLGVCLYEALAGRSPFAGRKPGEVAQLKTNRMPPSPASHNPGAPAKLVSLCMRLLETDPARRPGGAELLRALQPQRQSGSVLPAMTNQQAFAGRGSELELLGSGLARSCAGLFALVLVEGESGIGKSTLVAEFMQRARRTHSDVLILRSRCYENELLELKAFDGAMGELARTLSSLSQAEQAALLPAQAGLLSRLFSGLGTLPAVANARHSELPADPAAQRLLALQGVRRLLWNVARRYRLVLEIDDLHWGDAESFHLLELIAQATEPPPLLVVATARAGAELSDEAARRLARVKALPGARRLELRGLSLADAGSLAVRLLGGRPGEALVDRLVAESRGHPLLLAELVNYAAAHPLDAEARPLSLDEALRARIDALPAGARRLIAAVAIAGRPYPSPVFARALELPASEVDEQAGGLLAMQLLRRRGARELACHHDRIREVAASMLDVETRRTLHRAFAAALVEQPLPDLGEVARHLDEAGAIDEAVVAYASSAEQALEALAFARAEQLAARALELSAAHRPTPGGALERLMVARGHALSRAGRGVEAAAQYLEAAERAQGDTQLHLRVLSAQHLLQAGRLDEGKAAARRVLAELGVPLPRSAFGMKLRSRWDGFALRWTQQSQSQPGAAAGAADPRRRMQLDALWAFAAPLGLFDASAHEVLSLRHLRLARVSGDSAHWIRALAEQGRSGALRAPGNPSSAQSIAQARALCDQSGSPELDVVVSWAEGLVASLTWQQARQQERLEHALDVATRRCAEFPALLTTVRYALGGCWDIGGEHAKLASESTRWVEEAHARSDHTAIAVLEGLGAAFVRKLMAGDFDSGRACLAAAFEPLPEEPFMPPHWGELVAVVQLELCRGGAGAREWLSQQHARHGRAALLDQGFTKARMLLFRANAALAACRDAGAAASDALLREVGEFATRLDALGQSGDVLRLRAQLCALRGEQVDALRQIHDVRTRTERAGLVAVSRAELYLEGLIEGGEAGAAKRRDVLAFFQRQGWRQPLRAVARVCPAVDLLPAPR